MNIDELKISVELMTKFHEITGKLPYEDKYSMRSEEYISWLEKQVFEATYPRKPQACALVTQKKYVSTKKYCVNVAHNVC